MKLTCKGKPGIADIRLDVTFDGQTITVPSGDIYVMGTKYHMDSISHNIANPIPQLTQGYLVYYQNQLQLYVDEVPAGSSMYEFNSKSPMQLLHTLFWISDSDIATKTITYVVIDGSSDAKTINN